VCLSAVLACAVAQGLAQEKGPTASTTDPRVGLKPGLRDAGVAAKNMELVATLGKPEGFYDPKKPAGETVPAERPQSEANASGGSATPASETPATPASPAPAATPATPAAPAAPATPAAPGAPGTPPAGGGGGGGSGLDFANSDIAFSGTHMFLGNFHGFQTYDIERTNRPRLLASVVCPGGQGDMSIYGNLLFMSVEQTRGRIDCGIGGVSMPSSPERFRGIRIFDIKDLRNPKQLAAVQTCRGSHTHTLVGLSPDRANLYVYGSGTGQVRPGDELAGCSGGKPEEDPDTALFSIDVIEVPLAAPQNAKIVNRPRIFADLKTGAIAGLWAGGTHGDGTQRTSQTTQCHDITVYPEIGLAAGACAGNGILMDIKDPKNPVRLDAVTDKNFAYWHSATFNNDGTKIIFTDEWGGGTRPRCRATDLLSWGADAVFDIVDGKTLKFGGYYKMPAAQTDTENCVAHNGSIIPIPGRDIMVQAWYQGGLSVFDFTDSTKPFEIAYFDRGPVDAKNLVTAGYWSTYWFNGNIFGSEIARGVDVFKLLPSEHLTKNELDAALLVRMDEFNAQQQPRMSWPAATVVARAYLDQLNRSKGISAARATEVKSALDKADKTKPGPSSKAALDSIDAVAASVEAGATAASARDAMRLKALAATMKGRTAALR
jgi:hypothetical protein